MDQPVPSLSVVVIGRNEGERLPRCLQSIRDADYPRSNLEVIYVDSDSTDGSSARAERLGAKVISLKSPPLNAAAARNAGFRLASCDLIHFLDGDTIVHASWLKTAVRAMDDLTVACVFGRREEVAPCATIFNFWAHHDWYRPPGVAHFCGGDALFRRHVLDSANGFDETLIAGEEPDLCFRIRHCQDMNILCLDAPMVLHDINMTRWQEYWLRSVRTGYAKAAVGIRYHGIPWWQPTRWREPIHAFAVILVGASSLALWSLIPLAIWVTLVVAIFSRNVTRVRPRFCSARGACLYVLHQYIAKLPITIGMCRFWLARALARPQQVIEYRMERAP